MAPHTGKYVAYFRVSTDRQGESGLGIEAQRQTVEDHLNGGDWELVAEYTEVESGRKQMRKRPQLKKALDYCKANGCTLIAARVDRITRNLAFLSNVLESGVDVIFCNIPQLANPAQNKLILHIMASIAEYEGAVISERTKDALAAAKRRGVKLGSRDPKTASDVAAAARATEADTFAKSVGPIIVELQKYGCTTLNEIGKGLKARGIKTSRGKFEWHASAVKNVIQRYENLTGKKIK